MSHLIATHPVRRKIVRDIILDWPAPPVPFPKRSYLPATPAWPLLMTPWRGGFQSMFDPATGMFHWKDYPPVWNTFTPESEVVLMGETYDPEGQDYLKRLLYNRLPGHNLPPTTQHFLVNDTGQVDLNASQRSYNVVNLGPQPSEVNVPQIYQVNSPDTLNKYLKCYHDQGYVGAICRGLEAGCSDPQFIVIDPL